MLDTKTQVPKRLSKSYRFAVGKDCLKPVLEIEPAHVTVARDAWSVTQFILGCVMTYAIIVLVSFI